MSDSEENSCPICCEEYNIKNKEVKCQFCPQTACLKCVKRYLLESNDDPKCMDRSCKIIWPNEFLMTIFNKTFINGEYKKHRQSVLLNREKAFLPADQEILTRKTRVDKRKAEISPKINKLKEKLKRYQIEMRLLNDPDADIDDTGHAVGLRERLGDRYNNNSENTSRKQFIRKCPVEDCRGFLSSQWKCGLCEANICKDCCEVKTKKHEKDGCDPDLVETMKEIMNNSKPCPGCGLNTHKIEGCSMMFCTVCKIVWDYNSGEKLNTNRIHNPHYFEWLRAGGTLQREPGDIPCGGLPQIYVLENIDAFTILHKDKFYNIRNLYQFLIEMRDMHLPKLHHPIDPNQNQDIRLRYLKGDIDEKGWSSLLTRREKDKDVDRELYQLYSMFCDVSEDIFRRIENCEHVEGENLKITRRNIANEFIKLTEYVHNQAVTLSIKWNRAVPVIVMSDTYDIGQQNWLGYEKTDIRWGLIEKHKWKTPKPFVYFRINNRRNTYMLVDENGDKTRPE